MLMFEGKVWEITTGKPVLKEPMVKGTTTSWVQGLVGPELNKKH
jgi:hypothetical protein